jgi:hypothetical protein
MAKKATSTDTDTPDASQLGAEISTALTTADTTAVQRILELQRVRQARVAQLTRTAAALKARYGTSDPSVMAAEANVAAATLTAARIGLAQRQAATPDPQVSASGWTLHGQVCDAHLQPVSGFTVFLADASKTYQRAYGFAYTDAAGNFQLNYAGLDSVEQDKSAKAASNPDLFVEVANAKGELVPLSPTPFQPTAGGATYLNIMLLAGSDPSADPPAQIRDVAFPPKSKTRKKARKDQQ